MIESSLLAGGLDGAAQPGVVAEQGGDPAHQPVAAAEHGDEHDELEDGGDDGGILPVPPGR